MICTLKISQECKNHKCNKAIQKLCPSFKVKEKYETDGKQIFNIPNNLDGLDFLNQCKKYLNDKRYRLVRRGRASNRPKYPECGYDSGRSLRVNDSDWFAVYPKYKPTQKDIEVEEHKNKIYYENWKKEFKAKEIIKSLESLLT